LKGKSKEILKLLAATVMKMKTKKSYKETGTSKQSEALTVLSPKNRRQVKVAKDTALVMESASAMGKRRPGRASKKSKTVDL
jgi:hypothetical protein